MLASLCIQLQAINAEKNIFRQYEMYVGKDLFGTWLLTIAYGRIGRASQVKNYPFDSLESLQIKIKNLLRKRLASEKRIGTNYFITSHSVMDNISNESFLATLHPYFASTIGSSFQDVVYAGDLRSLRSPQESLLTQAAM